jgi:hypothetical protein
LQEQLLSHLHRKVLRKPLLMRWIVIFGAALGLCSFAGLEIANAIRASGEQPPTAVQRPARDSDALPAAVRDRAVAAGLELSSARRISADTYVMRRRGSLLCLVSVARGMSAGCNPEARFFHGEKVVFGISEEGAPDAPGYLRIAGVAREDVAKIRVRFDGATLEAATSADGGFAVEATARALAHGRPTTLEAIGKDGKVLRTYSLPSG